MSGQSSQSIEMRAEVENYFCVLCPDISQVLCFPTKQELEKHLRETHLKDSSSDESHAINVWIERHIKYQELLNKSMTQTIKTIPDRNKTIYRGCPVCDRIIKVFNIQNYPNSKGTDIHELVIRDINVHYSGNNVNHINPHMKYYPYECLICEDESEKSKIRGDPEIKEVVKTSVKAMMRRHIIDKHLKNSPLVKEALEEEIERSIKTLKVMVLEKVTKKESSNPRPIFKKKKIKSIPGPLRKTTESAKRLPSILPIQPTIIQLRPNNHLTQSVTPMSPNDKYLIPIASVGPLTKPISLTFDQNIYSSQPLMTSTPIQKTNVLVNSETNDTPLNIKDVNIEEDFTDSSDEMSESEFDLIKDKSEVFGCVFCLKRFINYDEVFDHYLVHCNVFIECAKCDLKFKTISDFRSHNSEHNENCNLLNINQFKAIRKWIEKFLGFIKNERKSLLDMCCDINQVYCGVCLMVLYVYNYESKRVLSKEESVKSHIHNHFNYFPFECIDCNYEDIKTEFFLDSKAKKHLYERHDIKNSENMDLRKLSTYFVKKSYSINKLDELIEQSVEISEQQKSDSLNSLESLQN